MKSLSYDDEPEFESERIISRFLNSRNDIVKLVKDLAKIKCKDDGLLKRCEESTAGKLCFRDGVYCFETREFRQWDAELLNEVHSLKITPRSFPQGVKKEDVEALRIELFDNMFISASLEDAAAREESIEVGANGADAEGDSAPQTSASRCNALREEAKLFLQRLARAIAGHGQTDKMASACIGARNCGKTLITDLLEEVFGRCDEGGYIGTVNRSSFLKKTITDGDIRQHQWLAMTIGARVVFASETPPASSGGVLDSTILKSIIGSDGFTIRMHNQDPMKIKSTFGLVMMMNDSPVRLKRLVCLELHNAKVAVSHCCRIYACNTAWLAPVCLTTTIVGFFGK